MRIWPCGTQMKQKSPINILLPLPKTFQLKKNETNELIMKLEGTGLII